MTSGLLPSFAQYHEDLILLAALPGVDAGFYVDIGANDPDSDSVTKLFYLSGWIGINVDPLPGAYEALTRERPRDTNLNVAVGASAGSLTFREYPQSTGLSTLKPKPDHAALDHIDHQVKVITPTEIFDRYVTRHVDFLKIDVEGCELDVLEGADWERHRPTVVCAEADDARASAWEGYLEQRGYIKFLFDGLNRYYMAQERQEMFGHFGERLRRAMQRSARIQNGAIVDSELGRLQAKIAEQEALISELRSRLGHVVC